MVPPLTPSCTLHVTVVSVGPVTVATNGWGVPATTVAAEGSMAMLTIDASQVGTLPSPPPPPPPLHAASTEHNATVDTLAHRIKLIIPLYILYLEYSVIN
jgi:hypothetical protein